MFAIFRGARARVAFLFVAISLFGFPVYAQNALDRLNPNFVTAADLAEIDSLPNEIAEIILAAQPFERTANFDALVSELLDDDALQPELDEVVFAQRPQSYLLDQCHSESP